MGRSRLGATCREGTHACSAAGLAYWINETLWEIELDGEILLTHRKIDGQWIWVSEFENADSLEQVAAAAREAVEALSDTSVGGVAGDAAAFAPSQYVAMGPFIAACAAGHAVTRDTGTEAEFAVAFTAERQVQSEWIATRLLIA